MSSAAFRVGATLALAVVLAFLAIPLVAIFVEAGPAELVSSLGREGALEALRLSLETSLISLLIIVAVGTPAAYLLARCRFHLTCTHVSCTSHRAWNWARQRANHRPSRIRTG